MVPQVAVTVMFTDLVDSTTLTFERNVADADALRRVHFGVLNAAISTHRGRVVKNLGDGMMAVFASAGSALDAAVAIEQASRRHREDTGHDLLRIRIGISGGDCTEEAGDYFGAPVIEAARLCARADGGQIFASAATVKMASRKRYTLESVGPLELKGIPEPVATVEVIWDDAPHAATPIAPVPVVPLPGRFGLAPRLQLVGRHAERARLRVAWELAQGGQAQTILISGEPGLGKTRLAIDVAREAFDDGAIVLYGRCDDQLAMPYRPWIEALDRYVEHVGPSALGSMPERVFLGLEDLLPTVRELRAGTPPTAAVRDPYLMHAAVTHLLMAAAAVRPVVIVLDDLHWADHGSLALLRHLVSQATSSPLLLLGTYRDTDIDDDHPLTAALAALRRDPTADRVPLLGLTSAELSELVENPDDGESHRPAPSIAETLRRQTGGNPFLLEELLAHLAAAGVIEQLDEGGWSVGSLPVSIELPNSVKEVVADRIRRLPEPVPSVLGLAAVCGAEIDVPVLTRVLAFDDDEVFDALDVAARAGLLTDVGHDGERFEFVHDLVRAALYDDLGGRRRAVAHRSIAEAIESMPGEAEYRAAEVARHWFDAGRAADRDAALRAAVRAGRRADDARAPQDAADWYRRAVDLDGDRDDTEAVARRAELLVLLGDAQRRAGDPASRTTLLEAAGLARRVGDGATLAVAALANHRGFAEAGVVDEDRVAVIEAALQMVPDDDRSTRARLLGTLASELSFEADHRRIGIAERSIEVARQSGDADVLLDAILRATPALMTPDLFDVRCGLTEESMLLTSGLRDERRATALQHRETVAMVLGNIGLAREIAAEHREISEYLGEPTLRWTALAIAARLATLSGDLDEAERLAGEVFELGIATGQPDAMLLYGSLLLVVRLMQGRTGELIDGVTQLAADHPNLRVYPALRAFVLATSGDVDGAEHAFADLAADNFDLPDDDMWLMTNTLLAQAAAKLGHADAGAVLGDRLEPYRHLVASNGVATAGAVSHALACCRSAVGRADEAAELFADAVERHTRLESPYFQARSMIDLAEVLELRDPARSQRIRRDASEIVDRHGLAGLRSELDRTDG